MLHILRGFEGTDLATLAHLECPTVCHGHPVQILLLTSSLKQAWTRPFVKVFCGERGIRTPETLLEFTRFPGVPLQPLEHLSFRRNTLVARTTLIASLGRPRFLLLTRAHKALVSFSRLSVHDRYKFSMNIFGIGAELFSFTKRHNTPNDPQRYKK